MAEDIIDPSWEIAEAMRRLLQHPGDNQATWSVFQKVLGGGISQNEYWDLISVLNVRLLRLTKLIKWVDDKEFNQAKRNRALVAVQRFSGVFTPQQQAQPWQHTLSNVLIEDDALALDWFSTIAKRYQPLRKLNDEDQSKLIEQLDAVLSGIDTNEDIPRWAKEPLAEGLRRLRLILKHIVFFGCETAIDELLGIYHRTQAVEAELLHTAPGKTGAERPTIISVLAFVALAGSLFAMPEDVPKHFNTYKGWLLKVITENSRLPKPTTLLIEGPRNPSDAPPSRPEGAPEVAIEPKTPEVEATKSKGI